MGIYRGPNLIKEGLVFGYDTGYGVSSNSVATRYNPGEPTTNMYTNSDFSNGESDWTFASWDGNISHTATTVQGPYGNTVSAVKLTVNSASSYSHFHQYNNNKYTSGNAYTQSAWVKGHGTMWGKSHWGGNTQFTMTGDWQYITYTVNATSSSSSNFPYWGGEGLTPGTVFYMTDAQTEANSHATPYVKSGSTTGSRSNTESLIDLKRTTDLDLSNVSFGDNAQLEFDGTNDYIELGDALNSIGSMATFEMVFKATETNDSYRIMLGWGYGNSNYSGIHIGSWTSGYSDESFHVGLDTNAVLLYVRKGHTFYKDNQYHHAIVTAGKNNYAIWIDGEEQSITVGGAGQGRHFDQVVGYNSNITAQIGKRPYGGGSGYFKGDIPVMKVYDRILSDDEIKHNYKVYKNRFNI